MLSLGGNRSLPEIHFLFLTMVLNVTVCRGIKRNNNIESEKPLVPYYQSLAKKKRKKRKGNANTENNFDCCSLFSCPCHSYPQQFLELVTLSTNYTILSTVSIQATPIFNIIARVWRKLGHFVKIKKSR